MRYENCTCTQAPHRTFTEQFGTCAPGCRTSFNTQKVGEWKPNPMTSCSVFSSLPSPLVTMRFTWDPPSVTLQSDSFADPTNQVFNENRERYFRRPGQPRVQCAQLHCSDHEWQLKGENLHRTIQYLCSWLPNLFRQSQRQRIVVGRPRCQMNGNPHVLGLCLCLLSTVGDVCEDPEFSAPGNSSGLVLWRTRIARAQGFSFFRSVHMSGVWIHMAATSSTMQILRLVPVIQLLICLFLLHLRTTNFQGPESITRSEQAQQRRLERKAAKHERHCKRRRLTCLASPVLTGEQPLVVFLATHFFWVCTRY